MKAFEQILALNIKLVFDDSQESFNGENFLLLLEGSKAWFRLGDSESTELATS
jgi:hypothetical protein